MGLISFIKNAGRKLFNRDEPDEKKVTAIEEMLRTFNLGAENVHATFDGDDTVTLTGQVKSVLTKKRIVATIGNVDGAEKVNDNIVVVHEADEPEEDEEAVRYYEVKSGDTLSAIALEMYGDASKYPQIFEANKPMLEDPDKIYPGQKLVIPADK